MRMKKKVLSKFGHVQRMSDETKAKTIYDGKVNDKRGKGRPRLTLQNTEYVYEEVDDSGRGERSTWRLRSLRNATAFGLARYSLLEAMYVCMYLCIIMYECMCIYVCMYYMYLHLNKYLFSSSGRSCAGAASASRIIFMTR